jgi:hypothetical protein
MRFSETTRQAMITTSTKKQKKTKKQKTKQKKTINYKTKKLQIDYTIKKTPKSKT